MASHYQCWTLHRSLRLCDRRMMWTLLCTCMINTLNHSILGEHNMHYPLNSKPCRSVSGQINRWIMARWSVINRWIMGDWWTKSNCSTTSERWRLNIPGVTLLRAGCSTPNTPRFPLSWCVWVRIPCHEIIRSRWWHPTDRTSFRVCSAALPTPIRITCDCHPYAINSVVPWLLLIMAYRGTCAATSAPTTACKWSDCRWTPKRCSWSSWPSRGTRIGSNNGAGWVTWWRVSRKSSCSRCMAWRFASYNNECWRRPSSTRSMCSTSTRALGMIRWHRWRCAGFDTFVSTSRRARTTVWRVTTSRLRSKWCCRRWWIFTSSTWSPPFWITCCWIRGSNRDWDSHRSKHEDSGEVRALSSIAWWRSSSAWNWSRTRLTSPLRCYVTNNPRYKSWGCGTPNSSTLRWSCWPVEESNPYRFGSSVNYNTIWLSRGAVLSTPNGFRASSASTSSTCTKWVKCWASWETLRRGSTATTLPCSTSSLGPTSPAMWLNIEYTWISGETLTSSHSLRWACRN